LNNKEVIDEIGDCIIRIEILKMIYPVDEIQNRVDYKTKQILEKKKKEYKLI